MKESKSKKMSFSKQSASFAKMECESASLDSFSDEDDECEEISQAMSLSLACDSVIAPQSVSLSRLSEAAAPKTSSSSFLSNVFGFFGSSPSASASALPSSPSPSVAPSSAPAVFGQDALISLLMCQTFEGSFNDSAASLLTGLTAAQIRGSVPAGVEMSLWITLVVLSFLEHKASADRDQWEMNLRKAQKWIKSKVSDSSSLQQQAKSFVTSSC